MIKKSNKIKKVTIDDLARMIKEDVIDQMATKENLRDLEAKMATKEDLRLGIEGVKNLIEDTNRRIDDVLLDRVKYSDFNALKKRVDILEKT